MQIFTFHTKKQPDLLANVHWFSKYQQRGATGELRTLMGLTSWPHSTAVWLKVQTHTHSSLISAQSGTLSKIIQGTGGRVCVCGVTGFKLSLSSLQSASSTWEGFSKFIWDFFYLPLSCFCGVKSIWNDKCSSAGLRGQELWKQLFEPMNLRLASFYLTLSRPFFPSCLL